MNKARRARITKVMEALKDIEERLIDLRAEVDELDGEEREALENMPEGLRASERGQRAEECADAVTSLLEEIGGIASAVTGAIEYAGTAAE